MRVPYPIVLVLGGLALAFVPGMPDVDLDAHVVLLVFIPPLLLSAGWYSSPRELRAESRALGLLALALVLVTMAAVAVAAHALVDGLPWPAAFMLGAVVAPTDAVAAVATFASVRVPERVRRLVQGESLINDATGLTAFRVAVAAAGAEGFSWAGAFGEFVLAAAGGAADRDRRRLGRPARDPAPPRRDGLGPAHACWPPTRATSRPRRCTPPASSPPPSAASTAAGTSRSTSTPTRG